MWSVRVIMVDLTKYLCQEYNLLLRSLEQILFMHLRLKEQVNISRIKEAPARMPLQNTRVCPRMRVVILIRYVIVAMLFFFCVEYFIAKVPVVGFVRDRVVTIVPCCRIIDRLAILI